MALPERCHGIAKHCQDLPWHCRGKASSQPCLCHGGGPTLPDLPVGLQWPCHMPWQTHGIHDSAMAVPWRCRRNAVAVPCQCHGSAMTSPWKWHGLAVALSWQCHGCAVALSWQCLAMSRQCHGEGEKLHVGSCLIDRSSGYSCYSSEPWGVLMLTTASAPTNHV